MLGSSGNTMKETAAKASSSFTFVTDSATKVLPVATKDALDTGPSTVTSTEQTEKSTTFLGALNQLHCKTATPLTFTGLQTKLEQENLEASGGIRSNEKPFGGALMKGKSNKTKPFVFFANEPKLECQWRNVEWTEDKKSSLVKTISSYKPNCDETTQARVLLLGPVGSGKSSFISSVQSVFSGRVINRAMVGSSSTGFTKKLQSFNVRVQKGEVHTGLVLCDTMGLGDGEMTGPTLHDILSVIKGHVPEGHKFSPDQPVSSDTVDYVKRPSLKDKIHCVVFVVDASQVLHYPKGLSTTFQQLREHISHLGVHQVALLTHVDAVSPETANDTSQVYKSRLIKEMMGKAGALLGMSTSYIVPVKNYSSELDLDTNTDVLLLSAVDHILQYADLYFQDNISPKTEQLL